MKDQQAGGGVSSGVRSTFILNVSKQWKISKQGGGLPVGLGLPLYLTLVMRYIFLPRIARLAEYFFPIPYKIGTFLRSAVSVKFNFGSKLYNSRSLKVSISSKTLKTRSKSAKYSWKNMAEKPTNCQFSYFLVDLSLKPCDLAVKPINWSVLMRKGHLQCL